MNWILIVLFYVIAVVGVVVIFVTVHLGLKCMINRFKAPPRPPAVSLPKGKHLMFKKPGSVWIPTIPTADLLEIHLKSKTLSDGEFAAILTVISQHMGEEKFIKVLKVFLGAML